MMTTRKVCEVAAMILFALPLGRGVAQVRVGPDGNSMTAPANTTGQTVYFSLTGLLNGYSYSLEWYCNGAVVSCNSPNGYSVPGTSYGATVPITFNTGGVGTGRLRLKATGAGSSDSGWFNVSVKVPYAVTVVPDGGTEPTRPANTGGYSAWFDVQNTGANPSTFSFTCVGSNGVICGTVPASVNPAVDGPAVRVWMPYSVGDPGASAGTLRLTALGSGASDPGTYTVPIVRYGVTVTTTSGVTVTPTRFENTTGLAETFLVTNTGSDQRSFNFSCTSSGPVNCGTGPAPVTLGAGAATTISMPYSVGSAGSGSLTLTANGTNATSSATYGVPVAVTVSKISGGALVLSGSYLVQETALIYDDAGRIRRLSDGRGSVTEYEYGPNPYPNDGFLTRVKRWRSSNGSSYLSTDIGYTSAYVTSIRDEGGTLRAFDYDGWGKLTQIRNNGAPPDGQQVIKRYAYTYSRTAPAWTFQASNPNTITETTFLKGGATPVTVVSNQYFDGLGRAIQSQVQDGSTYHVTATQYDLMGRVSRVWQPFPRSAPGFDSNFDQDATSYYNSYHSTTLAHPFTETRYRADALNRVSKVYGSYIRSTPIDSVVTSYGIEDNEEVTELTDESQKKRRSYADGFNSAVKTILGFGSPDAATTLFTSNVVGQRTQATDPRGLVTTYTVNTRGMQISRTSPDVGTINTSYDAAGNARYFQDANQAVLGQVYFTIYDSLSRAVASGIAATDFASLDPLGPPQPFETTRTNWLIARRYDAMPPDSTPWNLFPTPPTLLNISARLAGVASKSNGAWQVTYFSYDAEGQIATRYTYTQANGGGAPPAELNTTIAYTRDLRGSVTQRTVTVGANSLYQWYEYDARGLLSMVFASTTSTKPLTPDVTDTYLSSGQPQSYQFQNGPVVPIRYTIRGQTDSIGDPSLARCLTCPFSAHYAYQPNGVLDTAEFYNAGAPAPAPKRYRYVFGPLAYDALNRLKQADFFAWTGSAWGATPANDLAQITYDLSGNLRHLQRYNDAGNVIDDLSYSVPSSSNRLDRVDDAVTGSPEPWDAESGPFTYDANGNLKTAPAPYSILNVTYDAQNLPLAINSNGAVSNYRYDEAGQRIAKQAATGGTDFYLREGATIVAVVSLNGTTPPPSYFNILWENRVVGRQVTSGNRTYDHVDILGSTRTVVLSTTGAVVESYDFDPWGLRMPGRTLSAPNPTKEGFSGKEQDVETALDYFGARYYMPAIGRWSSVDPLADKAPAWSTYAYAYDNPVGFVDPTGRQPCYYVAGGFTCYGLAAQEVFRGLQSWWAHRNDPTPLQRRPECQQGSNFVRCMGVVAPAIGPLLIHLEKEVIVTTITGEAVGAVATRGIQWFRAVRSGKSVWSLGWATRGLEIEAQLGGNLPAGFRVIDRYADGVATSIKSMDLAAGGYQEGSTVLRTLKGYINKLETFSGASMGDVSITAEMMANSQRVLTVAIPEAGMTAAQLAAFQQAGEYALSKGINMIVVIVR